MANPPIDRLVDLMDFFQILLLAFPHYCLLGFVRGGVRVGEGRSLTNGLIVESPLGIFLWKELEIEGDFFCWKVLVSPAYTGEH